MEWNDEILFIFVFRLQIFPNMWGTCEQLFQIDLSFSVDKVLSILEPSRVTFYLPKNDWFCVVTTSAFCYYVEIHIITDIAENRHYVILIVNQCIKLSKWFTNLTSEWDYIATSLTCILACLMIKTDFNSIEIYNLKCKKK